MQLIASDFCLGILLTKKTSSSLACMVDLQRIVFYLLFYCVSRSCLFFKLKVLIKQHFE